MSDQDQYIIKKINTEQSFSDMVFRSARAQRFGISGCCPTDIDKISIKKELCDWEDLKTPVYTSKAYTYEEWLNTPTATPPSWGDPDCNDLTTCNNDLTCLFFDVVNQDGNPVEGYPVIVDGGNIGVTDEYGNVRTQIPNASVDTVHTIDLCKCITTVGACSQMKIVITLTEECPTEACTTPEAVCSSTDNFIEAAT
tara:strand:- start:4778 stop:5368 length:591 start_codon:yes stop_codon:yes gene_type:complete